MAKIHTMDAGETENPPASCKVCVKNSVCLIVRTLKGLQGQFEDPGKPDAKAPFDPTDFAKICSEFVPAYLVRVNGSVAELTQ